MNDVTVILPVFNLRKRGLKRVMNSVFSLQEQNCDVIVVDSSCDKEFNDLSALLKGLKVIHYKFPLDQFNKPKMLNEGIKLSKTKFIFCSDGDYIFRNDLIRACESFRGEKILLHKKVKMLPAMNVTTSRIKAWKFPEAKFNEWGTLANGAMQYATKDFFLENPYNEEMDGFGAMDNLTAYVAMNKGFKIRWIAASEILHQHHTIEKKLSGTNLIKFKRNQKILQEYIDENKLPKILKR